MCDCITADYFVFDTHGPDIGIENMTNGLVDFDIAASFPDGQPTDSRDTDISELHLDVFAQGSTIKRFYSDNDGAFIAAAKRVCWKHDSSKPYDPQSSGLIESHVRLVKDGARSLLYQAGMPAMCWPWAVKYFFSRCLASASVIGSFFALCAFEINDANCNRSSLSRLIVVSVT